MQQTVKPPTKDGPGQRPARPSRPLLGTRRGLIALAITVAILGAGAIFAFLQQYRDSVNDETRPVAVLVAKELIGKGTAGEVVASDSLFQIAEISEGDAKDGAITDPASLRGKIATRDVFPGQQLTTGDFVAGGRTARSRLTGRDRAISISVDDAHGLIGQVQAGDHVDVLAAFIAGGRDGLPRSIVRTLAQDVLVLKAPAETSDGPTSESKKEEVVLRVTDEMATAIAFTVENGKLYLTLRPPSHAGQSRPGITDIETLLTGLKPLVIERDGRNR